MVPLHCLLAAAVSFATATGPAETGPPIPAYLYPRVEASVDRNEILIGDDILLSVTVVRKPSVEILARGREFDLGQFEIKDIRPGLEKTLPNGDLQKTDVYKLSTYFTGEFEIPPLDIRFRTEDGREDVFRTAPIAISVRGLTPEEAEDLDIRDIKPPVLLEGQSRWPLAAAAALGALTLIGLGWWLWRRRRAMPEGPPQPPPLPAHEIAFRELEALRAEKELFDPERAKEFSIRVSQIIRRFIYNRWGVTAMDETTFELMGEIKRLRLGDGAEARFRELFGACDLMKFAKHQPDASTFGEIIGKAWAAIDAAKAPAAGEGPPEDIRA